MTRRLTQMIVGCILIGLGVALILNAGYGADGYATAVDGISDTTGIAFWIINSAIGVGLIALAWARGIRPGIGTLVAATIVGAVVSLVDPHLPQLQAMPGRSLTFALGFAVLALGVAAYLAASLGAGPAEAAALAFDPPIPFRWGYGALQLIGATSGWLLGAAVGVGTLIVVLGIGPAVDTIIRRIFKTTPRATIGHEASPTSSDQPSRGGRNTAN